MKLNHICPCRFLQGSRVFSVLFCSQHQYHNIARENTSTFSIPIPINSQRVTATGPGSLYFAFRKEEKTSDLVSQKVWRSDNYWMNANSCKISYTFSNFGYCCQNFCLQAKSGIVKKPSSYPVTHPSWRNALFLNHFRLYQSEFQICG